jgi:nitrite reductase/ring-hydroxylating ferredoxin subunit/uncharacterized membrane protein
MVGRFLERIILAQNGWAKPLGDWLHGIVAAIFGRMRPVRDFLAGTWLGHPLHALLTDVPIGALTVSIILDLIGQPAAADVALAFGILTMLAAALAGYADYSTTDGRARVRATIHSVLIVVSLVFFVISLALRWTGPADRAVPIALSILGYVLLAGGAYVGGDVAYLLGNMVDRHAWRSTGTKWQPLEAGEIGEGVLVKAKLGIQDLVLVRTGETILALHDQCAHAGGPLHEGTLSDGVVECPWHASRFELATGRRRSGPTVYDQPTYEVRKAEAGGFEARRSS